VTKGNNNEPIRALNRLNIELDLQSLFGLLRIQLNSLAETPQPSPPPLPPYLGSYTRALLVSQDRRHLFVTLWNPPFSAATKEEVVERRWSQQIVQRWRLQQVGFGKCWGGRRNPPLGGRRWGGRPRKRQFLLMPFLRYTCYVSMHIVQLFGT
jgi:hypothetical protein